MRGLLTAEAAAAELGVSKATLYAYVSRGLLRSEAGPDSRSRRYAQAEVEALKQRKEGRRDPRLVARRALAWGVPVLDSQLALIAGGRLYYRGREAVELARRGESLERVAALLWLGDLDAPLPRAPARPAGRLPWSGRALAGLRELAAGLRPFERMMVLLPLAAAGDPASYDLRPAAAVASGVRLPALLAAAAAGSTTMDGRRDVRGEVRRVAQGRGEAPGAAEVLARAWAPRKAGAVELINAALVLSADHELNVSAFTARCAASAGAPPHAAVLAGLAALGGPRHGGYCDRVEAFLAEVESAPGARERIAARLRRGEEIPAFSHPLYPQGDPRGALLLELAAEACAGSPRFALPDAVAAAVEELLGERPTLDFGLVAVARALGLPAGAALALFAVGRSVGWIAHALEQYEDGRLIRPRARYVGPPPSALPA